MADLGDALKSILQVPGLQEMLNQSVTQQRQLAPVRSAVSQQALNMLPNSAFGAGGRPDVSAIPQANFTTPAPSGDHDLLKTLSLLAAGGGIGIGLKALLEKLLGGGGGNGGNSGGPSGGGNNGSSTNLGRLIDLFKGHGGVGNYPNKPGDGFGGPGTTTISSNEDPFSGPIDTPYNGPDATYEPGGYNFSGPMPDSGGGGGDTTGTDWWDE